MSRCGGDLSVQITAELGSPSNLNRTEPMRLADFISANLESIQLEWDGFARSIKSGEMMDALALRDHAEEILLATIRDMRSAQSAAARLAKSRGHDGGGDGTALNGASEQ